MKCDFHVHSCYSYDSTSQPKQIVDIALEKGIDCLAVTDHEEIRGVAEVEKWAEGKPLLIIPGIEVKSRKGDILGFNIREVIEEGFSAEETIREIQKQGGIAIVAHPFGWPNAFKGRLEDLLEKMDGIEAFNASIFPSSNEKALQFARKHNTVFTAGSDAHFLNSIGRAYLEIPGDNLSIKEVLRAIKEKRGKIGGEETNLKEKIINHTKRNIEKVKSWL